jgi:hypothetical protein
MKIKIFADEELKNLDNLKIYFDITKLILDAEIIISDKVLKSDYRQGKLISRFPYSIFFLRNLTLELFTLSDFFDFIPFQFVFKNYEDTQNKLNIFNCVKNYETYKTFGEDLWLIKSMLSENKTIEIIKTTELGTINKQCIIQKVIEKPFCIDKFPLSIRFQIGFFPIVENDLCLGYDIYGDFDYNILINKQIKKKDILNDYLIVDNLDNNIKETIISLFNTKSFLERVNQEKLFCFEVINIFFMLDEKMNIWIIDISSTNNHNFYSLIFNKFFYVRIEHKFIKIASLFY